MKVSNVELSVRFKNAKSVLCKQPFGGADVVVLDTQAEPGSIITVSGDIFPVVDVDKDGKPKSYERDGKINYRAKLILRPLAPSTIEAAAHVAEAQAGAPEDGEF